MKNKEYSKGVFLNIFSKNKTDWKKQINFINSLPDVNHIEILLEDDLSSSEIRFLKSLVKKYNVIIHGPFAHLSLISPHYEVRDLAVKIYLRTLKTAEFLGAKVVTFHVGAKLKFTPGKGLIKILIQNLRRIKDSYKGKVVFTIENLPPEERGILKHFPCSLKDLVYIKRLIPWINFTLDIGHAFQSGENLEEILKFIKKYKNSIKDIHLHDGTLNKEAHLAIGKGDLDIDAFFRSLNKIGYNNYITLETISKEDTKNSWSKIYKL